MSPFWGGLPSTSPRSDVGMPEPFPFGRGLMMLAFPYKQLKGELITRSETVKGGLAETAEDRAAILQLVEKLEKQNPTKR
jgi:hypothetical protein